MQIHTCIMHRHTRILHMTVSTENATSPTSIKTRDSDFVISRGTNSNYDFDWIWICNKEFGFLSLVNFRDVAFSVEFVLHTHASCICTHIHIYMYVYIYISWQCFLSFFQALGNLDAAAEQHESALRYAIRMSSLAGVQNPQKWTLFTQTANIQRAPTMTPRCVKKRNALEDNWHLVGAAVCDPNVSFRWCATNELYLQSTTPHCVYKEGFTLTHTHKINEENKDPWSYWPWHVLGAAVCDPNVFTRRCAKPNKWTSFTHYDSALCVQRRVYKKIKNKIVILTLTRSRRCGMRSECLHSPVRKTKIMKFIYALRLHTVCTKKSLKKKMKQRRE